jgi:hypothetical protein
MVVHAHIILATLEVEKRELVSKVSLSKSTRPYLIN